MLLAMLKENRHTLKLAAPMIAGQLGQMMMGWADTIMAAKIGVVQLAACSFAVMVFHVFFVSGFGLISSVSIRVSHAYGANQPRQAGEVLLAGIVMALLAGFAMVGLIHLALPWLPLLGQDPLVLQEGRGMLLLLGWSVVPALLNIVGKDFSESLSRPWLPFWIMMGGVALNVLLNWLFIYGNWGMPRLGLTGAGLGTLLARVVVVVVLFAALFRGRAYRPYIVRTISRKTLVRQVASLFRLGWPSSFHLLGEVGLFAAATLMMGWLGATALAAHQVAITCAATAFMFPLGLALAVTVRVGQSVGAGEHHRVRPIAFGAIGMGLVSMATFALVFIFGGGWIAGRFVDDPAVASLTATLLMVAGFFALFDGTQIIAMGGLRGLADVRIPMIIIYIAYWGVALPSGYWLAFRGGWNAPGIWMGLLVGLFCASGAILARFCHSSRRPVDSAVSREAAKIY